VNVRADLRRLTTWRPQREDYTLERSDLRPLLTRLGTRFLFILVPAGLLAMALAPIGENYAFDFRVFYDAGHAFLNGQSPYPEQSAAVIASKQNFLYPAPIAALFAPFSLLPFGLAAALFALLVAAAPIVMLWILGVRDWRCYGAVYLGLPLVLSVALGTISTFLALGVAVLWKYRDRPVVAAPVLALLVVSKLFLWPLGLWFLVTQRSRTAFAAAGIGAIASLLAWWHVGLDTLSVYPDLLRLVAEVEQADSFSPTSLGIALGISAETAQFASMALGLLLFAAVAARRSLRNDDLTMLVVALAAALICSPIVWAHYLVVLFVPLAIARPRIGLIWLATFWMTPDNLQYGSETAGTIATVLGLVAIAAVLVTSVRGRHGRVSAAPQPVDARTSAPAATIAA
jgi:alpha-1,2-mannosyltransferase